MKTTLNEIRKYGPCGMRPWLGGILYGLCQLMDHLGKKTTDDDPVLIRTILDSNGVDDALWCLRAVSGYDREKRLLAVAYVREMPGLEDDPVWQEGLLAAEQYANGLLSDNELRVLEARILDRYADDFKGKADWRDVTVHDTLTPLVSAAAFNTARAAVKAADLPNAARAKQADMLRALCLEIEAKEAREALKAKEVQK